MLIYTTTTNDNCTQIFIVFLNYIYDVMSLSIANLNLTKPHVYIYNDNARQLCTGIHSFVVYTDMGFCFAMGKDMRFSESGEHNLL